MESLHMVVLMASSLALICLVKADCVFEMDSCNNILTDKYGPSIMDLTRIKNLNKTELVQRCYFMEQYTNCVKQILPRCILSTQLVVEGLVHALEYYCGEGQELGLRYSSCVSQSSVIDGIDTCTHTYTTSIAYFTAPDRDTSCTLTSTFINCAKRSVAAICGDDAANFIGYIIVLNLWPTIAYIQCNIPAPRMPTLSPPTIRPTEDRPGLPCQSTINIVWSLLTTARPGAKVGLGSLSTIPPSWRLLTRGGENVVYQRVTDCTTNASSYTWSYSAMTYMFVSLLAVLTKL